MRLSSPRVIGILIGVLVFAAVTAFVELDNDEETDRPPSETDATATASSGMAASVTATPPRTDIPSADDAVLVPIDDGFVLTDLAPDKTPEVPYGIVIADLETGEGEFWQVEEDDDVQGRYYTVDPTHRWLQQLDFLNDRLVLADRTTGDSYEADLSRWHVVAGPTAARLLVLAGGGGDYAVIDLASDPTKLAVEFNLGDAPSAPIVLSTEETHLRIGDAVVELATGEVTQLDAGDKRIFPSPTYSYASADGGWLDIALSGDPDALSVKTRRYDALGRSIDMDAEPPLALGQQPGSLVSPDGRWLVTGTDLGLTSPSFTDVWPSFVLVDLRTGEPIFRAVRVSIPGAFQYPAWLADSSGLLVGTPSGFAILRPDGSLDGLPFGPVEQSGFAAAPIPIPVPSEPDLLIFDGRVITVDGQPVSAEVAAAGWANHVPWNQQGLSADAAEIRLVQSIPPGKDVSYTILTAFGLPAQVQRPPFPDEVRLRVDAGGDGLNVRAQPNMDAEIGATLPDGTLVTVTDHAVPGMSTQPDEASMKPDTSAWAYDVPWWVHIRAEDGIAGWVRSEFVAWAE